MCQKSCKTKSRKNALINCPRVFHARQLIDHKYACVDG
jgi:hypothetical protein